MKYLSEFFVPYDSFLETNILLTSKPCILNSFLLLQKLLLLIFLSLNFLYHFFYLYLFTLIFIMGEKKCKKTFYSNLGIL